MARFRQRVGKAQLVGPMFEVSEVELVALHLEDADDIVPLSIGDAAAESMPVELVKDDVLRRDQVDRLLRQLDDASPREGRLLERRVLGDEYVDLEATGRVNDVERSAFTHCVDDRVEADVVGVAQV